MTKKIASIDFGTNTARLLIAEILENGTISPILIEREIVRMGGGFTDKNGLSPEAMNRGIKCLERFSSILSSYQPITLKTAATSAVRDAANRDAFLTEVKKKSNIDLEVIDGIEEGELTLKGVLAGLDTDYEKMAIFDVGGGSTEYTLLRNGKLLFIDSLPIGVVRLTEGKSSLEAIEDKVDRELKILAEKMAEKGINRFDNEAVIATAGTATTVAAISLKMESYDYRLVNNYIISKNEIERIYAELIKMSPAERLKVAGLEKGREDLIIAGIIITLKSIDFFGVDKIKVSDFGLLEGLAISGASL